MTRPFPRCDLCGDLMHADDDGNPEMCSVEVHGYPDDPRGEDY